MSNIVLGVSGSIAAYRAADLARDLMRDAHTVRVCLTDAAQKFVTPVLFETLTGNPCLIEVFDEPDRGRMAHIDWARQADAILVAPATANTIARIAHGIGNDMLTTLVLATEAPLVVAPAMNPHMFASETNQTALQLLKQRAAIVVEPAEGDVACGEQGQGKLASNQEILEAIRTVLKRSQKLKGKKVLITSGPTQEPIDGVRFLSNRSSGKMGAALARAALMMGAEVTVIAGPQPAPFPLNARVIKIRTAREMLEAALKIEHPDIILAAAAVADYRPENPATGKIRRSTEPIELKLIPNPDIAAELAKANPNALKIGFAAEPDADLAKAKEKIARKSLDAIAHNDVSRQEIGFESDQNELTLITKEGQVSRSGQQSKLACALWLLSEI